MEYFRKLTRILNSIWAFVTAFPKSILSFCNHISKKYSLENAFHITIVECTHRYIATFHLFIIMSLMDHKSKHFGIKFRKVLSLRSMKMQLSTKITFTSLNTYTQFLWTIASYSVSLFIYFFSFSQQHAYTSLITFSCLTFSFKFFPKKQEKRKPLNRSSKRKHNCNWKTICSDIILKREIWIK